jgi:hypothetical protein
MSFPSGSSAKALMFQLVVDGHNSFPSLFLIIEVSIIPGMMIIGIFLSVDTVGPETSGEGPAAEGYCGIDDVKLATISALVRRPTMPSTARPLAD